MKRMFVALVCCSLAACSPPHEPSSVDAFGPCSPVSGLDAPDLPEAARTRIRMGQEDFCLVLANREPVHAKRVAPPAGDSHPGRTYYAGEGYRLVVHREIFEVGGAFFGYYGPVLHFEGRSNVDGPGQLSQVRVVPLSPVYK